MLLILLFLCEYINILFAEYITMKQEYLSSHQGSRILRFALPGFHRWPPPLIHFHIPLIGTLVRLLTTVLPPTSLLVNSYLLPPIRLADRHYYACPIPACEVCGTGIQRSMLILVKGNVIRLVDIECWQIM